MNEQHHAEARGDPEVSREGRALAINAHLKRIRVKAFRLRSLVNYIIDLLSLQSCYKIDQPILADQVFSTLNRESEFNLVYCDEHGSVFASEALANDPDLFRLFLYTSANTSSELSSESVIFFNHCSLNKNLPSYFFSNHSLDFALKSMLHSSTDAAITVVTKSGLQLRLLDLALQKLGLVGMSSFEYLQLPVGERRNSLEICTALRNRIAEVCLQMVSFSNELTYQDKLDFATSGVGPESDQSVLTIVSFGFQFLLDVSVATEVLQKAYDIHVGRTLFWVEFMLSGYIYDKDRNWSVFFLLRLLELLNSIFLVNTYIIPIEWHEKISTIEGHIQVISAMDAPHGMEAAHAYLVDQGYGLLERFGGPKYRLRSKSAEYRYPDQALIEDRNFFVFSMIPTSRNQVFKCLNQVTRKLAIIKRISKAHLGKPGSIRNELELLQGLRHTNIVTYQDTFETADHVFLVMEYCESELMSDSNQARTEIEARQISRQILFGLNYLHSNHVVHRDIKPGNVLIKGTGIVKITDFGEAQLIMSTDAGRKFDITELYGTPRYMAPECLHNWSVTTGADIWSFGCLLGKMLTGKDPWSFCQDKFAVFFKLSSHLITEFPYDVDSISCSSEGKSLLRSIFKCNPQRRPKAVELLSDPYFSGLPDSIL